MPSGAASCRMWGILPSSFRGRFGSRSLSGCIMHAARRFRGLQDQCTSWPFRLLLCSTMCTCSKCTGLTVHTASWPAHTILTPALHTRCITMPSHHTLLPRRHILRIIMVHVITPMHTTRQGTKHKHKCTSSIHHLHPRSWIQHSHAPTQQTATQITGWGEM